MATVQDYWQDYLGYTGAEKIADKVWLCRHLELSPEYPMEIYRCGEESLIMLSDFLWEGKDALQDYQPGMTIEETLDLFLEGVSYTRDESVFMGLFGPLQTPETPAGLELRPMRGFLDELALKNLKKGCSPREAAQGSVSLQDVWPSGLYRDRMLLSAASCWLWGDRLADLGVITHARQRRQGYGRILVAYEAEKALSEGKLPLYRCETDNAASLGLAQSLGFEVFVQGQGAVVTYPEEEEE